MRIRQFVPLALIALTFACAPAPPAGLTDADRTAINAAEQASVKAVNNSDWEGWTSRFTSVWARDVQVDDCAAGRRRDSGQRIIHGDLGEAGRWKMESEAGHLQLGRPASAVALT